MPTMAATASRASGPLARTVTCWPLAAPSPMTPSTLLASARLAPAVSSTADSNFAAATASAPAGRACRSPASVTVSSQLSGMTCLLGCVQHRFEVPAGGRGDRSRDRAFHEGSIGDSHRLGEVVTGVGEQRADGEHRASEIGQDKHAGPGVGEPERAFDLGDAGPDAAVVRPARGGDGHGPAADLDLPRSGRISTPAPASASLSALSTLAMLVPMRPSSVPPAVAMVTVPPPICPARSAVPSASAALCETRTIPTFALSLMLYPEWCSTLPKGLHDPVCGASGGDSRCTRVRNAASRRD